LSVTPRAYIMTTMKAPTSDFAAGDGLV